MSLKRVKTAVLISGRGSNMVSLVEATQAPDYPAEIALVISNRPDAGGLQRAESLGVQSLAIDHKQFKTREAFERALHAVLTEARIEFICCAGFMRVLSPWFTAKWEGRMINIHPSLLPKYKGLHTHQRALEAGDSEHGASVHWVSAELDGGDVIMQTKIKIEDGDTPDTLAAKLLPKELELFPRALAKALKA
ncbi:MAG: phosphoribosylglycinamide formyltransferase [Maricaulaceae bacterium]